MTKLHEPARRVESDLAATGDDHEHGSTLLRRVGWTQRHSAGAHGIEQRGAQLTRGTHRVDPQLGEELGPQRIEDPGHHTLDAVLLLGDLRHDDIRVVAVGTGHEGRRILEPRLAQHVPLQRWAVNHLTCEVVAEEVEGIWVLVDNGDVEPLVGDVASEARAHSAATRDHNVLHGSPLSWLPGTGGASRSGCRRPARLHCRRR